MVITQRATRLHEGKLAMGFLKLQSGQELDAMDASCKMADEWGIKVDWHEFAYALDDLRRAGLATCTKVGGNQRYLIH